MAEDWDAADDDLEKLLDFDDVEVRPVPNFCKTLPLTDTEVAGTKSTGEPRPSNSADRHVTANTESVHAYGIRGFGVRSDQDAYNSSAIDSTPGTFAIASRVDKLSSSSNLVRFTTPQFETQLVVSGPNRHRVDSFKDRSGTDGREEGYVDTQRIESAVDRGKLYVIPTNEKHRKGDAIRTDDSSTDVQADVGPKGAAPALLLQTAKGMAADHAPEERLSPEAIGIRGRFKHGSSLGLDQADIDVEIVPEASVGPGVELESLRSERSTGQNTQAIQSHGARRLGSQFTEIGIKAPLKKRLKSCENVATGIESTQVLSVQELPVQPHSSPLKGDCGARDKRTVPPEAGSHERGSSGRLPYRIPGPAGALQDNFWKRTSNGVPRTTGKSLESGSQSDATDFMEGPWITAMDYLTGGAPPQQFPKVTIGTIKRLSKHLEHISELVAVIRTVVPNGFGDVSVVLKDPTGTISGYIHRSVLAESKYRHGVVPGAVLILRKVTVFSPNPYAHYLNITTENVHKVFGSEVGSSQPQTRVPTEKLNIEGSKMKSVAVPSNNPEELSTDLGMTQDRWEPTGSRNQVQHTKRQPVTGHDASHAHTQTGNQISLQKPRCGESAKKLPHAPLDSPEVTKAIHSTVADSSVGIAGDFTKSLSQVDPLDARSVGEKATQEAVLVAKAKEAGWDFGEDVELLLNDDLGTFFL